MQYHSSKNTSINTTRLPSVYNKVNWDHYAHPLDNFHVFDIGCGKMATQEIIYDKLKKHKIKYFHPWDPNHQCIGDKLRTMLCMRDQTINKVIICSNVLNVIDNDDDLNKLIKHICDMSVYTLDNGVYRMNPVYITVYEGDKTGIGKESKKDCWQRNERLSVYLDRFNDYIKKKHNHNANFFKIKRDMIVGTIQ